MTSPSLDSFLVSESFSLDVLSGRVSAFNIMDEVFVPSVPAMVFKLSAITSFEIGADPMSFDDRVSVRTSEGKELVSSEQRAESVVQRHRSIHLLWRIRLETEDDFYVVLQTRSGPGDEWAERHRKRISVRVGEHPLHGPGSAAPTPSSPPPEPKL